MSKLTKSQIERTGKMLVSIAGDNNIKVTFSNNSFLVYGAAEAILRLTIKYQYAKRPFSGYDHSATSYYFKLPADSRNEFS